MGACGSVTSTPTRTPTVGPSPTKTNTPVQGSVNYNAAPYVMPLENTPPDIASVMSATGIKAFTVAFILANGSSCSPAWDGTDPVSSDTVVQAYINTIRANGGDVVPSIGGYGGTKLGQVCADGPSTYNAYQQVVTKYNLHAIDFDIEEPEIENAAAVAKELYAAKQFVAQGLNVSVTMPVTTSGLNYFAMCSPNNTGAVLSWPQTNAFTPTSWNIMPFDGGFGSPMGTSTVNVAEIFHGQLKTCFGWDDATAYSHSGLSLMNGRSDTGEYTYTSDFTTILNYEHSHGMKRLTFWSVNRDRSCVPIYGSVDPGTKGDCSSVTQNSWDFTRIVAGF
jgi:chitinase